MVRLGDQLLRAHKAKEPGQRLVLWKSDIAEAYRLLPMHPYWQIKQVNTIDGKRYIDRCCAFGGRRSGDLFITLMGLILWAAEKVNGTESPSGYVDDASGWDFEGNVEMYHPYNTTIPKNQHKLLTLLDNIGVPHKEQKQRHGPVLEILGLLVDANELTITLSKEKKQKLVDELDRFIIRPGTKK